MIALVVAYTKNKVIGKNGKIPWKIKGEQRRFKELTTGNVVIMGRKTYEEINHPLPDRYTIVISKTKKFEADNCTTVGSLAEAVAIAGDRDMYISGGAALYREAVDIAEKMYITEIDAVTDGDTFFPDFDEGLFYKIVEQHIDGEPSYDYVTYIRKGN